MDKKIGIIGFGNMGSAIAKRIKTHYQTVVFDKDRSKTKELSGIDAAEDAIDLVRQVDIVILAVKPQDFDAALDELENNIKQKLIISIAAGITIRYIEKRLKEIRIIRAMPNLPARIGKGMICLCQGKTASSEDLDFVRRLFENLGSTLTLDEDMMDAATAISGSGPGYLYDCVEGKNMEEIKRYTQDIFIPGLTASAKNIGFTPEQAKILAETTAMGSIAFLEAAHLLPQELKKQVASRGGTTEAGLEVLHKGGSLEEAAEAALKRAKELSKKE